MMSGSAGDERNARPRVGLIGLGAIGEPVGRLLLAAGYSLTVHNRSAAAAERLATEGACIVGSPAEVASASDVVLLALPHPDSSEQVVLSRTGVLATAAAGSLLIDLSTVPPLLSQQLHATCAAQRVGFIDAPVSGGPEGAAAGTLTIMCGGDAGDVERALPVLQVFGARIEHLGPAGSGSALKLVNQLLVTIHSAAAAEAVALANALGLDGERAFGIIGDAWGTSRVLERVAPKMLARDFAGGATVNIVGKDSDLIAAAASQAGLTLHVTAASRAMLQAGRDAGQGSFDVASLLLQVEQLRAVDARDEV